MSTLLDELAGRDDVAGETFTGSLEQGERLADVAFTGCTFAGCGLAQVTLAGCTFEACTFDGVDLSGARLLDSVLDECTFVGIRALGTGWGSLRRPIIPPGPSTWRSCRLDLGAFGGADLTGATFAGCRLTEADLDSVVLRGATFAECDLTGARLIRTDLREADLRSSYGYVVDPRENQVSGLRVDLEGVLGLLAPFGVLVE